VTPRRLLYVFIIPVICLLLGVLLLNPLSTFGPVTSGEQVQGPQRKPTPLQRADPALVYSAVEIFALLSPAAAYIETPNGSGSGILVDDGYVVTNAHVVWPDKKVRVVFPDGTEFLGVPVVKLDLLTDLAVVGPLDIDVPAVKLADGEGLPIGSDLYLVGYPTEREAYPQPTITRGLLSRKREWQIGGITYFQSDATIVGGQSGGMLVSADGQVIGISGYSWERFAFSASASDVQRLVVGLINGEDLSSLGARELMAQTGRRRFTRTLQNRCEQAVYILYEPADTYVEFKIESKRDAYFQLLNIYAEFALDVDDSLTGIENRSFVTDLDAPYFLILGLYQEPFTPIRIESNQRLSEFQDPDDNTPVQVGDTLVGNIDFPGDIDCFVIDLQEGEAIDILADSVLINPKITVRYPGAPQDEVVVRQYGGGGLFGDSALVNYVAPHRGDYYVFVEDAYGDGAVGGYYLRVSKAEAEKSLS
jgi:hypothetical protein